MGMYTNPTNRGGVGRLFKAFGVLTVASLLAAVGWRWASRRHRLPCPSQLAWLVDDRLLGPLNLTRTELDRLGLRPGMRVLEVGPGPGRLLVPAARRVLPGGEAVGLELQPAMARRLEARAARENVTNVAVVVGDATERHCEPESYDLVYMVTVLGEIVDRQAALKRAYEVLRPGGVLSVTETFPDPHYQTRATVLGLADAAGFRLAQVCGRWYHYTANFVKA